MTATVGATPSDDVSAPMPQSVLAQKAAFTKLNQSGGRHSAHFGRQESINGVSLASREPSSKATAARLRQIASRQQRLRLTQPSRPVLQNRRRMLAGVKRNLVKLVVRVDWTKLTAFATAATAVAALFFSAQSLGSTETQYGLTARGQLSDRFNKAIGDLDSKTTDVLVGGIYSLEQLTQDPNADENLRTVAFEELDSYVAGHSPKVCPTESSTPSADVQAALTVIGRRQFQEQIDLRTLCLNGANLRGALLENAKLQFTTLTQATLSGANLASADLSYATLQHAFLVKIPKTGQKTNLKGAILFNADLTGANLTDAILTDANLTDANLTGANLTGANLDNICYESPPRWPKGFNLPPSSNLQCGIL